MNLQQIIRRAGVLMIVAVAALITKGAISIPAIIGEGMVLQQQSKAHLWGLAKGYSTVKVSASWSDSTFITTADPEGAWSIDLPTPVASSMPQSIALKDVDGEIVLKDILIGEVWYCSGQSNMEMPVMGYKHQPVESGLDVILSARPDRPIRMFTVEKGVSSNPLDTIGGHWGLHTPAEVAECSATAYFFADHLSRMLDDVPVGLIISVWGGTKVQPWMSEEAALSSGLDVSGTAVPVDRSTPDVLNMPSTLYNAMVAPVLPYTVKGMLWYQGEGNCDNPEEYSRLMPRFVKCMRDGFGRPELPFYYVQIAPYDGYGELAQNSVELRLVQAKMMDEVDHCGMAVTLDIGDCNCIHPANKKEVGKRLAYWALAKEYGLNDYAWSGPVVDRMQVEDGRALLFFKNTGGGVSPLEQDLEGFEVAGDDDVYYPARAIIECETGTLGVYTDKITNIRKVRYGYSPCFKATLFDNFGLPASPFVIEAK